MMEVFFKERTSTLFVSCVYAFFLLSLFTDAAATIDDFFYYYIMNGVFLFFFSCPVYVFLCNLKQKYIMTKGKKRKPTEVIKLLLIIGFTFFPSSFI
jgi:hypothetical protein